MLNGAPIDRCDIIPCSWVCTNLIPLDLAVLILPTLFYCSELHLNNDNSHELLIYKTWSHVYERIKNARGDCQEWPPCPTFNIQREQDGPTIGELDGEWEVRLTTDRSIGSVDGFVHCLRSQQMTGSHAGPRPGANAGIGARVRAPMRECGRGSDDTSSHARVG